MSFDQILCTYRMFPFSFFFFFLLALYSTSSLSWDGDGTLVASIKELHDKYKVKPLVSKDVSSTLGMS